MTETEFRDQLQIQIPPVLKMIQANCNLDIDTIAARFYQSKLFAALSDESTKLWYLSALTLYHMYLDELITGSFVYPESATA